MIKSMELCEGRHTTPAKDGAIFPAEIDPRNLAAMADMCEKALAGVIMLDLYVTGLTVALVAVINYCYRHNIQLMLWHYEQNSGRYYPQSVINLNAEF